ncbi:hypothetical protein [Burkholderia gladioli]|uniref:hypothetical protein n=1 Tax=Burkholderia gladioli TaxID=28095 RepID=UPI00164007FD|nr:hypothetical protein [Burkholderia gladioli]
MRQAYSILKRGDEAEYLIEAAVFRKDVCAGFDHKIVAKGGHIHTERQGVGGV